MDDCMLLYTCVSMYVRTNGQSIRLQHRYQFNVGKETTTTQKQCFVYFALFPWLSTFFQIVFNTQQTHSYQVIMLGHTQRKSRKIYSWLRGSQLIQFMCSCTDFFLSLSASTILFFVSCFVFSSTVCACVCVP